MKIKKLTNRYYRRLISPYSIKFMNQNKQSKITEQFDEIAETMKTFNKIKKYPMKKVKGLNYIVYLLINYI